MRPGLMRSKVGQSVLILLIFALAGAMGLPLQAQTAQQQPTEVTHFQQLEDSWSIAFVKKDQYGMELLLSPTFVNISSAGEISTRNQLIAQMFDHSAGELLSMEQRVITARVLGDVALIEGTYLMHSKDGSQTVEERGVFTHVYQRARNSWACVNAQRTAVFDQTDAKQKQAGKKSSAALPFHIPLIYKGADSSQPAPPANTPPQ